jgi:hypothetical protein
VEQIRNQSDREQSDKSGKMTRTIGATTNDDWANTFSVRSTCGSVPRKRGAGRGRMNDVGSEGEQTRVN